MDRKASKSRRFLPGAEECEPRLLLSAGPLHQQGGADHPVRPNTPVLPYAAANADATFIDPSARIVEGLRISFADSTFVGPFAGLDASSGFLKVGRMSALLDNSELVANPGRSAGNHGVEVGDQTVIGFGARVEGPSRVGSFAGSARPTALGANARVVNATIEPGAVVGPGAVVSGVTIASGLRVLPGASVTTQAEASDLSLGKVVKVTSSDLETLQKDLTGYSTLAEGYSALYQGQSNTGAAGSPLIVTPSPKVFNGNLSQVRGTSREPASPGSTGRRIRPRFLASGGKTIGAAFSDFPARITGQVVFFQKAEQVASRVGRRVAIRGDEGQPITLRSIRRLGTGVTIHAERGGSLTIGRGFRAGQGAVILGGRGSTVGDGVTVGSRSVVERSQLGSGVVIGDGAIVVDTTLPDGAVVPAGAVIVNGVRR